MLMTAVTAVTISGAFVFGMVLALLGSLKLALAKRLDLGEARIGGLLSALNLALIPMMLLNGVLIDLWGVRGVMALGSVVTALAIYSLALQPTYARAFTAILLAGLGGAGLSTASIVLMPQAFPPLQSAAALNLGNVFFALGALITPVLADVLLRTLEFRRTVSLLALLCLVPAVACVLPGNLSLTEQASRSTLQGLIESPLLWLAGLVFFFYAPLEGSLSIWATTYLTELGHGEHRAAWLLSGFWTTFLASRLLAAFALHRLPETWNPWWPMVLLALLAAVVLGNISGTARPRRARLGLLVLGFLLGPIFPTLVAMLFRWHPQAQGTAYGLMFAIGSLGSLILAPVIGASARRRNVQTALRIPMLLALWLTAAALLFGLSAL
jgi:fucose permease